MSERGVSTSPSVYSTSVDPAGTGRHTCWCGTSPTPSGTLIGAGSSRTAASGPGSTSSTGRWPAEQTVTSPASGSTTR